MRYVCSELHLSILDNEKQVGNAILAGAPLCRKQKSCTRLTAEN